MSNPKTRRIYLNSDDSITPYEHGNGMDIDLSNSHIRCGAGEEMSIALVRAEIPETIGLVPVNTELELKWTHSGVTVGHTMKFNEVDQTYGGTSYTSHALTLRSTIEDVLQMINSVCKSNFGTTGGASLTHSPVIVDSTLAQQGVFVLAVDHTNYPSATYELKFETTSRPLKTILGMAHNTLSFNHYTLPGAQRVSFDVGAALMQLHVQLV